MATEMNQIAKIKLPDGLEFVDAPYVKGRLEQAGKTLMSLPATGTRPAQYRVAWPELVQAVWDAHDPDDEGRIPVPSAAQITAMDEAFTWIALVGPEALQTKRLIWLRLLIRPIGEGKHVWSWRNLKASLNLDVNTLQRRHARGVDRIALKLNCPDHIERGGSLP